MDTDHARDLLARAHAEAEAELARLRGDEVDYDRDSPEDESEAADDLAERGTEAALEEMITRRLEAVERAERRLAEGTYGRSVLSGEPIPDARLEIEPWAELTVAEAARG